MNSKSLMIFLALGLFIGCSPKSDNELFNLSPQAWFEQIIKDIRDSDLENADNHYVSFASEHIASPLLEQTMLILAQAHVNDEEYTKANSYLDDYIKRYGTKEATEFAKYLKIKANFDSFSKPGRNQKLVQDALIQAQNFIIEYPSSKYRALVETILTKLKLAEYYLDNQIYDLYERTNRNESAQIYKQKLDESIFQKDEMIAPSLPWYSRPFE